MIKGYDMTEMVLTDMDREWANSVAGYVVTDAEALELKIEFEQWVYETEHQMED